MKPGTASPRSPRKDAQSKQLKQNSRQLYGIKLELLNDQRTPSIQDSYYVKKMLIPYLSTVYYALVSRQANKDYLSAMTTLHYLGLPEIIGERIMYQINVNGDERIDHDEFVDFFVQAAMGSKL